MYEFFFFNHDGLVSIPVYGAKSFSNRPSWTHSNNEKNSIWVYKGVPHYGKTISIIFMFARWKQPFHKHCYEPGVFILTTTLINNESERRKVFHICIAQPMVKSYSNFVTPLWKMCFSPIVTIEVVFFQLTFRRSNHDDKDIKIKL